MRTGQKISPLMIVFTLFASGCATANMRFQDKIVTNPNDCWTTVQRTHEKVKGKKTEVTGTEVVSRTFDQVCGDRQLVQKQTEKEQAITVAETQGNATVKAAEIEAQATLEKARIEAEAATRTEGIKLASQMLAAGLDVETDPATRKIMLKKILERLNSDDMMISATQGAANAEVGLNAELMRDELRFIEEKEKASALLSAVANEKDPSVKANLLRRVVANLIGDDLIIAKAQTVANFESGLTYESIRTALKEAEYAQASSPIVKCKPVKDDKGVIAFICR